MRVLRSRIGKITIAVVIGLGILFCIAVFTSPTTPTQSPLSISFLGHTNTDGKTLPCFLITNNNQNGIKWEGWVFGISGESNNSLTEDDCAIVAGSIPGNSVDLFDLISVKNTNHWNYRFVIGAMVPKPQWKQRTAQALNLIGLHVLPYEEYWSTNSWRSD